MGSGGSWNPADIWGDVANSAADKFKDSALDPIVSTVETGLGVGDKKTPNPITNLDETPSLGIDTEAARRRKRALALQRGFLSTRKGGFGAEDTGGLLTPQLQGKSKLGQ